MNYKKLRNLNQEELNSIFNNLSIEKTDAQKIKKYYFVEENLEVDKYTFKPEFVHNGLQSEEIDQINPYVAEKLEYYSTTSPDCNLEFRAPELVKQFLDKDKTIVFFVGAGISRILRYPSWDQLADNAIDKLSINFYSKERIKSSLKDPLQKLSIFESHFPHSCEEYRIFYQNSFDYNQNKDKNKKLYEHDPYKHLVSDLFGASFITTNIDLEIAHSIAQKKTNTNSVIEPIKEQAPQEINNYKKYIKFVDSNTLEKDTVVMLHGRYDQPRNLVMSNFDYIKMYHHGEKKNSTFLKSIFDNYTVIFIGYGLAELPILETIFKSDDSVSKQLHINQKHYLLFDSFESETSLRDVYQNYFEKFNINLLPYFLDETGYDRIVNVLSSWIKLLKIENSRIIKEASIIEDFLANGSINSLNSIIVRIKQDQTRVLFNHFFKKVDNIEYYAQIKDAGFFMANEIIEQKSPEHLCHLPLYYLSKVVKQLSDSNEAVHHIYTDSLDIIKKITNEFANSHFKNVSWSIVWSAIEILKCIPNQLIDKKYVNDVPSKWISKFSESIDYITKNFVSKFSCNDNYEKAQILLWAYIKRLIKDNIKTGNYCWEIRSILSNDSIDQLFENCSKPFINFISAQVNYLRIKDYLLQFDFEDNGTKYHYEAKLIADKKLEFTVKHLEKEIVVQKGKFSFKEYKNEKKLKGLIINNILNFSIDPSIIDLYYFLHWGKSSYSLREDIFEEDEHSNEVKDILSTLLKNILIVKAKKNPSQALSILEELFNKYTIPYFKQVALPIIEVNFNFFSDFFLNTLLNEDIWLNELNSGYDDTLKIFLSRNYSNLNKAHVTKIISIIKNIDKRFNDEEDKIRRRDYEKLEWLEVLQNHASFKDWYTQLNKQYHLDSDYYLSRGKVKFYSGDRSEYSVKDLLEFSVERRYKAIIEFKQKDRFDFKGGTIRGLSSTIRQLTITNPSSAIELLEYNTIIPFPYMEGIIEGFVAIYEKTDSSINFSEENLFTLVNQYLQQNKDNHKRLVLENYDSAERQKEWLITDIACLIERFLKRTKEKLSFEKTLINVLQEISKNIDSFQGESYYMENNKIRREFNLNYSVNSSKGKIYLSLFEFAWYKHFKCKQKELPSFISSTFDNGIKLKHRDAFIVIGSYISQFEMIDNNKTDEWISQIILLDDECIKCFLGGFLFFRMQYCSKDLYLKLKTYFMKAIEIGYFEENYRDSGIIRALLIANYWDYESISGDVFQILLDKSPSEKLHNIIRYLRMDYDEFKKLEKLDSVRPKVLELWESLNKIYKSKQDVEIKKMQFELFALIKYWNKLDQKLFDLLKDSVSNYEPSFYTKQFLPEMNRLTDERSNSIFISELLRLLSSQKYCPFSEDEGDGQIYDILEKLADLNAPEINKIIKDTCHNLYNTSKGMHNRPITIIEKINSNENRK